MISGAIEPMDRSRIKSLYFSRSVLRSPSSSFRDFRPGDLVLDELFALGLFNRLKDLRVTQCFSRLREFLTDGDLFLVNSHVDLAVGIPGEDEGDQGPRIVVFIPRKDIEKTLDRRLGRMVIAKDLEDPGPEFEAFCRDPILRSFEVSSSRASIASGPSGAFSAIARNRRENTNRGGSLSNLRDFSVPFFLASAIAVRISVRRCYALRVFFLDGLERLGFRRGVPGFGLVLGHHATRRKCDEGETLQQSLDAAHLVSFLNPGPGP